MVCCCWCGVDGDVLMMLCVCVDGVVWMVLCGWCVVDGVDTGGGGGGEEAEAGWSKKNKKNTWQCGEQAGRRSGGGLGDKLGDKRGDERRQAGRQAARQATRSWDKLKDKLQDKLGDKLPDKLGDKPADRAGHKLGDKRETSWESRRQAGTQVRDRLRDKGGKVSGRRTHHRTKGNKLGEPSVHHPDKGRLGDRTSWETSWETRGTRAQEGGRAPCKPAGPSASQHEFWIRQLMQCLEWAHHAKFNHPAHTAHPRSLIPIEPSPPFPLRPHRASTLADTHRTFSPTNSAVSLAPTPSAHVRTSVLADAHRAFSKPSCTLPLASAPSAHVCAFTLAHCNRAFSTQARSPLMCTFALAPSTHPRSLTCTAPPPHPFPCTHMVRTRPRIHARSWQPGLLSTHFHPCACPGIHARSCPPGLLQTRLHPSPCTHTVRTGPRNSARAPRGQQTKREPSIADAFWE